MLEYIKFIIKFKKLLFFVLSFKNVDLIGYLAIFEQNTYFGHTTYNYMVDNYVFCVRDSYVLC